MERASLFFRVRRFVRLLRGPGRIQAILAVLQKHADPFPDSVMPSLQGPRKPRWNGHESPCDVGLAAKTSI